MLARRKAKAKILFIGYKEKGYKNRGDISGQFARLGYSLFLSLIIRVFTREAASRFIAQI